ncbi:MAG: S-adenosylmethionine:tRNA ribosyltransferase-isomerase [Candidatus Methylomirabilis sp.]
MSIPLRVSDFDFALPTDLIAQGPAPERDRSRLLILERESGALRHRTFCDLAEHLGKGDLLVINEAKVLPARLFGRLERRHAVEVLLIQEAEGDSWEALVKPSRTVRPGDRLLLANGRIEADVLEKRGEGRHLLRLACDGTLSSILWRFGRMPLPPYIKRRGSRFTVHGSQKDHDFPLDRQPSTVNRHSSDFERYQTVYAKHEGAIAAPTAGLHFTLEMIETLKNRGIGFAPLTLYIGPGTFQPVRAERVEDHRMESERYVVPEQTALAIKAARSEGRRVIAVGTTTARTLEYVARDGDVRAGAGVADLFIYPGHCYKVIDGLITNFHLPRSTLLMLVSAFAGRETILAVYREAIARRYRFYSYGDAMLIV